MFYWLWEKKTLNELDCKPTYIGYFLTFSLNGFNGNILVIMQYGENAALYSIPLYSRHV